MGHEATAMEKRGIKTYKGNINREIQMQNAELKKISLKIEQSENRIEKLVENKKSSTEIVKVNQKDKKASSKKAL